MVVDVCRPRDEVCTGSPTSEQTGKHVSDALLPSTYKEMTVLFALQSSTVANALIDIFCTIGPPAILQPDNGREFSGIASREQVGVPVHLSTEEVQQVSHAQDVHTLVTHVWIVHGLMHVVS